MGPSHHELDEVLPGTLLGPYELVAPIGAGGMARVWVARVRGTGQLAAVKMLLPSLAENVQFQQMFLDEARIASRLRHRNVCTTFELGQHQGTLYLAMEWVDGPSLMRLLRPGDPNPEDDDAPRYPIHVRLAARIVADTCAGLHVAHELLDDNGRPLDVVHRDVSPHNILLTSEGTVKITDFGVAKALGKSHMTIAGQLKGKLAYMSPEQLMGGGLDRRADVFALGCVLYELTTGHRPFVGEHDPQVMAAIMIGRYDPPTALVQGYPRELENIVVKALASEPDARFASAEHMRQALEAYLRSSGPPVMANQIAMLLRERCGAEIDARAHALFVDAARAAQAGPNAGLHAGSHDGDPRSPRGAPGAIPQTSGPGRESRTGGSMEVDGRPLSEKRAFLWVLTAALLGATLGLGVLSYLRTVRRAKAKVAIEAAASAQTPGPFGATASNSANTVAGDPRVGAIAGGTAGTAAVPASVVVTGAGGTGTGLGSGSEGAPKQRVVHLHIKPDAAVMIVDGILLPRGTEIIARPDDNRTMNVLVRADKYEDTIVLLDAATPDDVEVTLSPAVKKMAAVGDGGVRRRPDGTPATSSSAGSNAAETPPNPYD